MVSPAVRSLVVAAIGAFLGCAPKPHASAISETVKVPATRAHVVAVTDLDNTAGRQPADEFACTLTGEYKNKRLPLWIGETQVGSRASGSVTVGLASASSIAYLAIERDGLSASVTTEASNISVALVDDVRRDGVLLTASSAIGEVISRERIRTIAELPEGFALANPKSLSREVRCDELALGRRELVASSGSGTGFRESSEALNVRASEDGPIVATVGTASGRSAVTLEKGSKRSRIEIVSFFRSHGPQASVAGWVDNQELVENAWGTTGRGSYCVYGDEGGPYQEFTCKRDVALMIKVDGIELRLGMARAGTMLRIMDDREQADSSIARLQGARNGLITTEHLVGVLRQTLENACKPTSSRIGIAAATTKPCRHR